MKNIFLFLCSLIIGFLLFVGYEITLTHQINQPKTEKTSKLTQFSLEKAPKKSLSANIVSLSGQVDWTSRIAVSPTGLTKSKIIQQGEEVSTEEDGKVDFEFPDAGRINMSPNTKIKFIQILPTNFVFEQDQGISMYTKTGVIPLSIRSLDLLVTIISGESTISIDSTQNNIIVSVTKGSVSAAFNDADNTTNLISVEAGNQFVFDNVAKLGSIQ